jgi:transposase
MEDGAKPHTSSNNAELYINDKILRLPWAPNSPDLNLIEHAWRWMKVRIGTRVPRPTTVEECTKALLEEWENLPIELINKWIDNQRRRCRQVIEAKGNNTFHG